MVMIGRVKRETMQMIRRPSRYRESRERVVTLGMVMRNHSMGFSRDGAIVIGEETLQQSEKFADSGSRAVK